jgi:hypothetical protein
MIFDTGTEFVRIFAEISFLGVLPKAVPIIPVSFGAAHPSRRCAPNFADRIVQEKRDQIVVGGSRRMSMTSKMHFSPLPHRKYFVWQRSSRQACHTPKSLRGKSAKNSSADKP